MPLFDARDELARDIDVSNIEVRVSTEATLSRHDAP
jgi:hypothetical protein